MMIPQIRNTLVNVLIILIGGPLAGAYFAWQTGELTRWNQFWPAVEHGGLASTMMAIGWLLMRSPYAGRITELLQQRKTTDPSGTVKDETVKVVVREPEPLKAEPTAKD